VTEQQTVRELDVTQLLVGSTPIGHPNLRKNMGYKIWRRDPRGWSLAFDVVYETREDVDERIAELNAEHHDKIRYGELAFYPYRDDIKLARDGSVIDDKLPVRRSRRPNRRRPSKRRRRRVSDHLGV